MTLQSIKRRLYWHGMLIFVLGLLAGATVPVLTNPRMGVAAHVGGVLSGIFLILIGIIWEEIRLSARAERIAFWLFLYASHTGWLAQYLAAVFGTSRATPIAGAGYSGADWQEYLVYVVAVSFSIAILIACLMALWGLRAKALTAFGRSA
jgi:hydroxylaminobenzene mutase